MNALIVMLFFVTAFTGFLRYIIAGIQRLSTPDLGMKKDYALLPTLSVLLPCFNEGEAVYSTIESILASDYPANRLEIVVTDDCSVDDSYEWIQKAEQDFSGQVRGFKNELNMGKTRTILNALARSHSEMVMIVDSDTILAPNAIRELMACFADPKMGAVGGPASVRNPNDNALTAFQTYLYYLGFRLGKVPESYCQFVGCIGGYMLAMRRSVLLEVQPKLEARNWFGVKVKDGEDRFLTHQILLAGYKTYCDMDAECWTTVPNTFKKYWLQQLRWRRSNARDFFYTIHHLPLHVRTLHWMSSYVYILTPLVMVISTIQVVVSLLFNPVEWFDPRMALGYIFMSFFIIALIRRFHPEQALDNPLLLFVYAVWWVANNVFLTPLALMTLDSDGWGNRDKEVQPEVQSQQPVASDLEPAVEQASLVA